jgi:hypothetical protein
MIGAGTVRRTSGAASLSVLRVRSSIGAFVRPDVGSI